MGRIVGIDLGTTNSIAAYWKGKKPRVIDNEYANFTPSVVWVENGMVRVGRDAKDRLEGGSKNIIYSIKRFMGVDLDDPHAQKTLSRVGYKLRSSSNGEIEVLMDGKYYSPIQISAMILEQMKKDAEIKLGEEVTHAVITVPAYFGQRQKNATREAGQLAGLIVPRIISEPTAAALAFGIEEEIDEPQDVLVYDFGGGTFDVSILSIIDNNFDVLNIDGDRFLGGDDLDNLLVTEMFDYVLREYRTDLKDDDVAKSRLKSLAEKAKIELSRQEETRIINEVMGLTKGRPININMTVSRSHFESLIKPLVDKSLEIVHRGLEGSGINPRDLDRVLLVGGSTRIPLVRQRMKEFFGDKIQIDVDPMQCVGLGAAVQTAFLSEEELQANIDNQDQSSSKFISIPVIEKSVGLREITMQDMISKYIGIETEGGEIVSVVPKGTLYPTLESYKRVFQTIRQGQQIYELPIYECEQESREKYKWEWIGIIRNEKLPAGLPKTSEIMVEMSVDKDGILYVESFLKNDPLKDDPEKGTLEKKSFHFGGRGTATIDQDEDLLADLDFKGLRLHIIAETNSINKYLSPQQIAESMQLVLQATKAVQEKDIQNARILNDELEVFTDNLPAPTVDVFNAQWIANDKDIVSPTERGEVQQLLTQMDDKANKGELDSANQYLNQLRQKNHTLLQRYSNLLRKK